MHRHSRQVSVESFSQPIDDVVSISPSSSKRRHTPGPPPESSGLFSSVNMFSRPSPRRQNSSDFQETIHLQQPSSPPPPPASPPVELSRPASASVRPDDIYVGNLRRTSTNRVPVGSKATSPTTPGSAHYLLSAPPSSTFMRSPTWEHQSTIHEHELNNEPAYRTSPDGYTNINIDPSDAVPEAGHSDMDNGDYHAPSQGTGDHTFYRRFAEPPDYCSSKAPVKVSKASWLALTICALSVYSTIMSGIWLVVAMLQPRWGHQISSRDGLDPSSATLLAALAAKTIEISFVTVFVSCLGQILSRRSIQNNSRGITLAEMTMRNWVIQPGSLVTHFETLPYAGLTILGALSLTATIAALLYTTASDAMISPKLKYGSWEEKQLSGYVRSSFSNGRYVQWSCTSVTGEMDLQFANESCGNVEFAGQSYRNLMSYMGTWALSQENHTDDFTKLSTRPVGNMLLYDNTTLSSQWIDTEYGDVAAHYKKTGRIINNATLSFPHPNVMAAAMLPENGILQPDDLGGVGEYAIDAIVASPTMNVMCVNMARDELKPLVYPEWPNARVKNERVGGEKIGKEDWERDVVQPFNNKGEPNYLNSTVVDDIFRWGKKYDRRPPVFPLYPSDYNFLTNISRTTILADSLYMLGKSPHSDDYNLCELRAWMSPNCKTQFKISGTGGASMSTECKDSYEDWDPDSFHPPQKIAEQRAEATPDWKWLSDLWRLSMDLNGGFYQNNASNARILTQLGLTKPELSKTVPSLAEVLAVFASSAIVIGAIDSPFGLDWAYKEADFNILPAPGALEPFDAQLSTQQYTSGHTAEWQKVFYVVLVLVFAINLYCLIYLIMCSGAVTDFTEPQNLFALAINSPPSVQMQGSCGGGPEKRDLVVPWKISYAPGINHYFFEEANDQPWRGKYAKEAAMSSSRDLNKGQKGTFRTTTTSGEV